MRVSAPLALATLSLSALSLGSPLDNQAVLLSDNFVQEPRWKYRTCGMSPSRPLSSGLICELSCADNDEDPIVHIKSIELSPDSPAPGKDLTVKVKAETSETIEVQLHSLFARQYSTVVCVGRCIC